MGQDGAARSWRLRLHLSSGEKVSKAVVDGTPQKVSVLRCQASAFPFLIAACDGGPVVELLLDQSTEARHRVGADAGRARYHLRISLGPPVFIKSFPFDFHRIEIQRRLALQQV